MADLGLDMPMFGISGIYDAKFVEIAGPAANGTIVAVPKVQSNPKLEAFYRDYEAAKFAEPPGSYAKYAYDATSILLQAIREHGPKDKAALAKAIRAIEHDGVLGRTTFDANGQTKVPVEGEFHVVKDGSWQPLKK
jgi:branched-chain amino acid transport system substrate-binding protein